MSFEVESYPCEIAEKLIELSKDMDFLDYEDNEKIKSELENALYYLKAVAENEYDQEYFRTFYKVLENL